MISPVLLCGGSGTRLWPLSRKSYPKQFVPLVGDDTLFQASAQRLSGAGFSAPVVLTNSDFRFIVTEQLQGAGIDPGAILIEPEGRNTAPAILAAALYLQAQAPDQLMLVAPSDHVVPDPAAFRAAVAAGEAAAEAGQIVTFGITPTHAETAYGYLELSGPPQDGQATGLERFVEKPDAATAADMLAAGTFLWNAGIFLFKPATLIDAVTRLEPDLLTAVQAALDAAQTDLGFLRLDPGAWAQARDVSIDYAVMERSDNLSVVPFGAGWSDLGGWDAVWREIGPDENGVALSGDATAINCENTLLRSEADGLEVVGIGLKNIMTIAMPDAVLVADMDSAQSVRLAVDALKEKGSKQALSFPKDFPCLEI